MNYSQPYPSSVPHIILVPQKFTISTIFYASSLTIQLIITLITLVLLIFTFVFKCKSQNLLFEQRSQAQSQEVSQNNKNLICQRDVSDHQQKNSQSSEEQQKSHKTIKKINYQQKQDKLNAHNNTFGQSFWNMTAGGLTGYGFGKRKQKIDTHHDLFVQNLAYKFAHQSEGKTYESFSVYRVAERRIIFLITFMGINVLSVNSFDSGIIGIVGIVTQIGLFIALNVFRCIKDWKISFLIYIVPSIICFYEYLQGSHQLYSWQAVI